MDTNAGEFVGEDRAKQWMERIAIGEIVKIKGEELEVVEIEKREITLKLLNYEERMAKCTFRDFDFDREREIARQREKMLRR